MKKFVIRPRAGGKSHEVVQAMLANPELVCVAISQQAADQLWKMAKASDPEISRARFISMHSAKERLAWSRSPVIVDNADIVLSALLGANIEAVTMNGTRADIDTSVHSNEVITHAKGYWNPKTGSRYRYVDLSTAEHGYVYAQTFTSRGKYLVKLSSIELER